ncbi:MAG: CPBP family intramembrane glutamic endopeptidase [Terricaulis sp.]
MTDFVLTLAALWLPVGALVLTLTLLRLARLKLAWFLAAISLFVASYASLMFVGRLIPVEACFGDLNWNWGGKIASIALSIAAVGAVCLLTGRSPRDAGVTLRQNENSVLAAIAASMLLIVFAVGAQLMVSDREHVDAETLLFQATMPGLDEELFWRGVFLLAMTQAVGGARFVFWGAPLSWGGALVALLFGLGHGMAVQHGQLGFSLPAIVVTGIMGLGLWWIRERTGSIVVPLVVHNLVNLCASLL